jgi:hypothetical protein
MPKLKQEAIPAYRCHKQSGQAIVTLNSRDFLLGPHDTDASRSEYRRRIAEWLANGRQITKANADQTIAELISAFKAHAEVYYQNADGAISSEVNHFRMAVRPLRTLYGNTLAHEFGPLALEAVRNEMIGLGWCRKSINAQIGRIKRLFEWAAAKQLVPAAVYHGIVTLAELRAGRSKARESEPVKPVPNAVVDATDLAPKNESSRNVRISAISKGARTC